MVNEDSMIAGPANYAPGENRAERGSPRMTIRSWGIHVAEASGTTFVLEPDECHASVAGRAGSRRGPARSSSRLRALVAYRVDLRVSRVEVVDRDSLAGSSNRSRHGGAGPRGARPGRATGPRRRSQPDCNSRPSHCSSRELLARSPSSSSTWGGIRPAGSNASEPVTHRSCEFAR